MAIEEYATFSDLHDWEPISVDQQLENIRAWATDGLVPMGLLERATHVDADTIRALEERHHQEVGQTPVTVITPHLSSTAKTAQALWSIVARNFEGTVDQESSFVPDGDSRKMLLAIDENLPKGTPFHANSERHLYEGQRILSRPAGEITSSRIDIDAYVGDGSAPFLVRDRATAPGVELLALLAHNPDLTRRIGWNAPELWIPGMQIHDLNGNFTPKTPIVTGDEEVLRLQGQWNDSGRPMASIPIFTEVPRQI